MSRRTDIDSLLRSQSFAEIDVDGDPAYRFAGFMADIEGCMVVVSDLKANKSRIYHGAFSERLGVEGYTHENSIWEKMILDRMTEQEREEKYLAELRFFNFLRHLPPVRRRDYYLTSHLRFISAESGTVDVLHRMYYLYGDAPGVVRYGICVYSPLLFPLPAKSLAVNRVTGENVELSRITDDKILSKREILVLSMVESGLTSQAIADRLCISRHTVSRHRQEILAKLQVRNSAEAICRARLLKLI